MSHLTLQFSNTTINEMKNLYTEHLLAPPPGAIFRARSNKTMITAYKSGKVLFQGGDIQTEASKWGSTGKTITPTQKKTNSISNHQFQPPSTLFTSNHIGSDESGTGDYFGPITTCATYVTAEQVTLLKEMGIQDSKAITDENIQLLADELIKLQIPYSLLIMHNEKYNDLQQKGWTQGKMKAMLHFHAIENLLKKIGNAPYDGILVDQFCTPDVYRRHIQSENHQLPANSYFMTKAESYSIAVAAASVLARASFLREMERLSQSVGFNLLKGASSKVDQLIADIMKGKGEEILPSIAKVHFANTNKARAYLK